MLIRGIAAARLAFRAAWLCATAALVTLALLPVLAGAFERDVFIVRGGSMEPAVPLGSVAVVRHFADGAPQVGEIITFRLASGTVVTHRVIGVISDNGLAYQTKGDASGTPDPVAVPASAVIGVVDHVIPHVGRPMTVLATTFGAVAAIGLLGGLLLAGWLMDELQVAARRSSERARVATEPAL